MIKYIKKWIVPIAGLIVLLGIFVYSYRVQNRMQHNLPVLFCVDEQNYKAWYNNSDGVYYVFLPDYIEIDQLKVQLSSVDNVRLNDKIIRSEDNLSSDLDYNKIYQCVYDTIKKTEYSQIEFVKTGALPNIHITTESGSMDYIHAQKGNEEKGEITVYTEEGTKSCVSVTTVKGRGNETWNYEKKPYLLTLSEACDILGMGESTKWILMANYLDESSIRNKMVYDFAKNIGMSYSPDSAWVNLYLNGEYAGLYLIVEKIEIDDNRVDIEEASNDLDSSFLVSMEMESRMIDQKLEYIKTDENQIFRIHEPYTITAEQKSELRSLLQKTEDSITDIDNDEWLEYIDLDSFARKYLIEEIFMGVDNCFMSQYFYRNTAGIDSKIYAGPVWDFDSSLGVGTDQCIDNPRCFLANRLYVTSYWKTPWFYSLYRNETFYSYIVKIYEEEFLDELNKLVSDTIDSYEEYLEVASYANHLRWYPDRKEPVSMDVSDFLTERIDFLNSAWIDDVDYHIVSFDKKDKSKFLYYAIEDGGKIEDIPVLNNNKGKVFAGWIDKKSGEKIDDTSIITEDMELEAVWQDMNSGIVSRIKSYISENTEYSMNIAICIFMIFLFIVMILYDWRRRKSDGRTKI